MRFSLAAFSLGLFFACSVNAGEPLPRATADNIGFPASLPEARRRITAPRWLLRNVTVIDGTGAPQVEGQDILIADGKIEAVGAALPVTGVPILAGDGMTVLPGLIDAHTHLQSVPGAALRDDPREMTEAQQLLQLRAYLASGVTSILDTGISAATLVRLRAYEETGGAGPTLFALAPFLTPQDGYFGAPGMRGEIFADLWPPIADDDQIRQELQAARPLDAVGVKVTMEDGMVFPIFRMFTDAQVGIIRREAAAVNAPIFVHSMTNAEHRRALRLKPYALVHAGLGNEAIAPDVLAAIKASGAYVASTVAGYRLEGWSWDTATMRQPWIEARVPRVQWLTATHPDASARGLDIMTPIVKPHWTPVWLARLAAPWFRGAGDSAREADSSMRAVRAMYEAGIPLVMGADEGNWPAFSKFFHGVGSLLEMELLETAGLPRGEVIVAATSRAARMLKQEKRIGSILPGLDADLVVVPNNPLEYGMSALHDIQWVVKHGVAKTPAAWLSDCEPRSANSCSSR